MKTHLISFAYFCASFVMLGLALSAASLIAEKFWDFSIPHGGIMAAGIAAIVAGQTYAANSIASPSSTVSTLHALAMCVFVIGVTIIQMRIAAMGQSVHDLSLVMAELVIPILLVLHFVILRVCFPLGARSGMKSKSVSA